MPKALFALRRGQLPAESDGLTRSEEFLYYYLLWCVAYSAKPLPSRLLGPSLGFGRSHSHILRMIRKLTDLDLIAIEYEAAVPTGRWEVWRYPIRRPSRVAAGALIPQAARSEPCAT